MGSEILGLISFALAATALARMGYGRRPDRRSADTALDRFRSLERSKQYQLASTVAG